MPQVYYDSQHTGLQIDEVVQSVLRVQSATNNGKIVVIEDGVLSAVDLEDVVEDADNREF